jgi:hypothetical protein
VDPAHEMAALTIPCLITQGSTDVQVNVLDAAALSKANPQAELAIIPNMNHVLKYCEHTDKQKQVKEFYDNPDIALNKELCAKLGEFIDRLSK